MLVNPKIISFVCNPLIFPKHILADNHVKPIVLGGDWDVNLCQYNDFETHKSIKDHFINGVPWEKTKFYEAVMHDINYGKNLWGCKSEKDFKNRLLNFVDKLYCEIKNNGYKSQKELNTGKLSDEVRCAIGRNGEIIFIDGRHRCSISKIINLDIIPVNIVVRHKQWNDFKNKVIQYAKNNNGRIYSRIMHPDFDEVPYYYGNEREKFINTAIIDSNVRKVIDIGAHWGCISKSISGCGAQCVAVENDPKCLYFMKMLRNMPGGRFDIWQGDIFKYGELHSIDAIVAMNIFHHFIKSKELHNNLVKFLNMMCNVKVILFQSHNKKESQMINSYANYDKNEFVDFICKHASMKNYKEIFTCFDGRKIFKIWR